MELIQFVAAIDVPLCVLGIVCFIWHFNSWAHNNETDTTMNVIQQLPIARVKVVLLMLGLLLFGYITNVALWSLAAVTLLFGFVLAVCLGDARGGSLFLFMPVWAVREWAFDFPLLVLHPPRDENSATHVPLSTLWDGQQAKTLSPLRPCGEIEIDGNKVSAISESGRFIAAGENVLVAGKRNGQICVRVISRSDGSAN